VEVAVEQHVNVTVNVQLRRRLEETVVSASNRPPAAGVDAALACECGRRRVERR